MQVTTQLVNELRQKTGAGVTKCKEALVATNGDIDSAIQWLRNIGIKPEMLERLAGKGLVIAKTDKLGRSAVCFTLKCETDFAAKNPRFVKLAEQVANDFLSGGALSETSKRDLQAEMTTGINEKIAVGEVTCVGLTPSQFDTAAIGSYLHSNDKLAVLVAVDCKKPGTRENSDFKQLLKDLAMHIAGANPFPKAPNREAVNKDLVAKEQQFIASQMSSDAGFMKKPENIRQKIVEGKMSKFYKENVLLEQLFVKDETKTVEQYLKDAGKKCSDDLTVLWFVRRQLTD